MRPSSNCTDNRTNNLRSDRTQRRVAATTIALVVSALLNACAAGDKTPGTTTSKAMQETATVPAVVTISAKDFAYEAPDTIKSGMVTLKLINNGPDLHHVQLLRITGGKTYQDLVDGMKAMKPDAPMPPWIETVAGPNSPAPGGEQSLTEELIPGNYALICLIPSVDKVPHFAKGMLRSLTVLASNTAIAPAPSSDMTITMSDYAWDLAPDVPQGKHMIKLLNGGSQPHEMFILQLAPGKTAADFLQWFEKQQGPPPAKPMGGISGMPAGATAYLPVDLPKGNYALLCFLPDAKDGKAHLEHGMIKSFTAQ